MKKQVKAFWLALLGVAWLIFMATACHKAPPEPEPDLPPETQTGAGTIGCYINDKPWWPKWYFVVGGTPFLEAVFNPLDVAIGSICKVSIKARLIVLVLT